MKLYTKILNEETKECQIINQEDAQKLGWQEYEVEQSYDGRIYLKGYCPQQPLDELKKAKRKEINQDRDTAEQGGFSYMGKVFDSDAVSCIRMSCAAQAMNTLSIQEGQPEPNITWTCKDNTTIDLNVTEILGLVTALAQWSNKCHEKATQLKLKIEEAQTPEDLELIHWNNEVSNE